MQKMSTVSIIKLHIMKLLFFSNLPLKATTLLFSSSVFWLFSNIPLVLLSDPEKERVNDLRGRLLKNNHFIICSFIILTVDIFCIFTYQTFFYNFMNISTNCVFLACMILSLLTVNNEFNIIDTRVFNKISLLIVSNFALFIVLIINYFYNIIYSRFICDFFNWVNVIDSNPKNLFAFFIVIMVYGALNFTVPLVFVIRMTRIKNTIVLNERKNYVTPTIENKNTELSCQLSTTTNDMSYRQV